jgi:hypothetical protein
MGLLSTIVAGALCLAIFGTAAYNHTRDIERARSGKSPRR